MDMDTGYKWSTYMDMGYERSTKKDMGNDLTALIRQFIKN